MDLSDSSEVLTRLPAALRTADDTMAIGQLRRYYGPAWTDRRKSWTGSEFDSWGRGPSGQDPSPNRFTPDDVIAVSFLSVRMHPRAVHSLLDEKAEIFAKLLARTPLNCDLCDASVDDLGPDGPGWQLWAEVFALEGVRYTIASKLCARKRPRLIPIWDRVIGEVTGLKGSDQWKPLRAALTTDGGALNRRLSELPRAAGLSEYLSPLRVFDVIAWLDGKDRRAAAESRPVVSKAS
jgi:hypothetical protein